MTRTPRLASGTWAQRNHAGAGAAHRVGVVSRGVLAAAALVLLFASDARSQPAASCTISTTSVAFGTYDVFATAPLDSTGTVRFNCNSRTRNILVTLSPGQSGTFAMRTLTKVGENLQYNLYIDSARSQIWGDGSGGSQAHSDPNPPNSNVTLIIYGRIAAGQDVSPGLYSDNIAAEINF